MDEKTTVDIGPGCFADGDLEVINYLGDNYYRACGKPVVTKEDGSMSHCVKRVNHQGFVHQDYDGIIREED